MIISEVIAPDGSSLSYAYDNAGRLIAITNPKGERIDYTLDAVGNRTHERVSNAEGDIVRQQRFVFDELIRLLQSIGADQHAITHQYDKAGNRIATTDGLGHTKRFAYDALNRIVATTDALDGVIKQQWNARDQLTSVTDQGGLTTEYHYNGFGEKVRQISPDTGISEFSYDKAGNLIAQRNAKQHTTHYEYDALNRITLVDYPAANDPDIHYVYDQAVGAENAIGRLAQVIDASGQTTYRYNIWGQLAEQTTTLGIDAGTADADQPTTYRTAYHYNAMGGLQAVTYPSGRRVNYQHHGGQLASITTQSGSRQAEQGGHSIHSTHSTQSVIKQIAYQAFGGVSQLQYGNDLRYQMHRDQNSRITRLQLMAANDHNANASQAALLAQPLYHKGYQYDAASNIVAIDDYRETNQSEVFQYDALNRLTQAQGHYGQVDYAFDAVGNRTERQISAPEEGSTKVLEAYRYDDSSNRLLAVESNQEHRQLAYDPLGNITEDQRQADNRALIYGSNNRLQSVERDGVISEYRYNAKGQRVVKRVTDKDGETTETHFHYGLNDQLLAETNAEGKPIRDYLYGAGQRVGMVDYSAVPSSDNVQNGILYFVHNDHLGAPAVLTDENQLAVWMDRALPFGEQAKTSNSTEQQFVAIDQPLMFPGQYADGETGYAYNYFRDYDPSLGRYIQSDPIGLAGGVNTFAYVSGNPLKKIDPTGLVEWTGRVESITYGRIGGQVRARFFLQSEVVNGTRWNVRVNAVGTGAVIGKGPVAVSASRITFNDGLSMVDPSVFEGDFVMANAGFSTPIGGVSASQVLLGNAASQGISYTVGYEVPGYSDVHGQSSLVSAKQSFVEDKNQPLMCPVGQ